VATDPLGAIISNLFTLEQLANGLSADAAARLEELFAEITGLLAKWNPLDVSDRYRQARIDKIIDEISPIVGEAFDDMLRELRTDLARVGVQQAKWAHTTIDTSTPIAIAISPAAGLSVNLFKSVLDANPFEGLILEHWVEGQSVNTVTQVRKQIQLGVANNETLDDIVRRVRGRSAGILRDSNGDAIRTKRGGFVHQFEGGVLDATTRQTEAIVRTAVNFIANNAHMRTFEENDDVVGWVEFLAVLDGRTTLICASLDGKRWRMDDPDIRQPPLHYGCRSVLVPVIDWDELGIEAPPESGRASESGPVRAGLNYEQWLRRLPAARQDKILGAKRAALFRRGTSLGDMVRQDGSVIRLDELEKAS
jgi:SPP1 gp7 family putative phage head morphogenesis protein